MSALWDALGTVVDPELDQPVTELGFVSEAAVVAGHARVRLRLPTWAPMSNTRSPGETSSR